MGFLRCCSLETVFTTEANSQLTRKQRFSYVISPYAKIPQPYAHHQNFYNHHANYSNLHTSYLSFFISEEEETYKTQRIRTPSTSWEQHQTWSSEVWPCMKSALQSVKEIILRNHSWMELKKHVKNIPSRFLIWSP